MHASFPPSSTYFQIFPIPQRYLTRSSRNYRSQFDRNGRPLKRTAYKRHFFGHVGSREERRRRRRGQKTGILHRRRPLTEVYTIIMSSLFIVEMACSLCSLGLIARIIPRNDPYTTPAILFSRSVNESSLQPAVYTHATTTILLAFCLCVRRKEREREKCRGVSSNLGSRVGLWGEKCGGEGIGRAV